MVRLHERYLGYDHGELTGRTESGRQEVKLDSGLLIWLYPDEFTLE